MNWIPDWNSLDQIKFSILKMHKKEKKDKKEKKE